MAKTRIFLCGYYGFGNTGDEVILQGIAAALRAELGEVELFVTSGGGHLEVPATAVPWQDVAGIRQAVRLADLVVVGGGGLFQDYWGVDRATLGTSAHHGITFYSWPLLLAAEGGVPALVWGVGVGPLASEEGRALVREAMAAATWVSVRDRASARLLGELGFEGGVELVPDPAWAVPRREVDRVAILAEMGLSPAAVLVAVAPRRWPEDRVPAGEALVQALRQMARRWPLGVVLVPFHRGAGRDDDEAAAAELAAALAGEVPCWRVPAGWSTASRFWLCAAADLTVGVRLHACLAAARGGRRPVGVAYDAKVLALFEELADPDGAREPAAWTPEELTLAIAERVEHPDIGLATARWEEASRRPAVVARRLLAEPTEQVRTKPLPLDGGRATMELSRRALQRRLEGILDSHRAPREVVLFLPSVYWQTEVFQRPNQLALALARAGCLVFFWEPPSTRRFAPGFHRVARRLYAGHVPGEVWAALHDPLVVALPYNRGFADTLGSFRLVYDVIDHLDVFPGGRAALEGEHRRLLAEAQVVTAVSRPLLEEVRVVRPDAVYLPNAADPEGIRQAVAAAVGRPASADRGGELRLGYFGSLAGWLDYDLLAALLEALPEARLELLGPDLDGSFAESGLGDHPRVRHLGARPYGEVHAAFAALHAGLIPFRMNEITAAVSPLKLYEYLAMGVPVVSTDLPECRGVPGVWVARSAEEMAGVLRQLVAGQLSLDEDARARFVAANTWGHRAEVLLEAVAVAPLRPLPRAHGEQ
ncbi:MAG: polysaccharide pyruvyl transferase family protein, partial [Acidobacteriota bacterium]